MAAQPKALPVETQNYLQGGGLIGWLTTVDHKRVAVLYALSALLFMMVGGIEAMLIRVQLWSPEQSFPDRVDSTTSSSRCTARP